MSDLSGSIHLWFQIGLLLKTWLYSLLIILTVLMAAIGGALTLLGQSPFATTSLLIAKWSVIRRPEHTSSWSPSKNLHWGKLRSLVRDRKMRAVVGHARHSDRTFATKSRWVAHK
jgi:hypothetical protein